MSAGEHWETLGLKHDRTIESQYDEQERLEKLCSYHEHSPASCPAGEYCTWDIPAYCATCGEPKESFSAKHGCTPDDQIRG